MYAKLILASALLTASYTISASEQSLTEHPTVTSISDNFAPSEGMWWDSENPGTGVALNIDQQGHWFAAIYLYNEDGSPTFLTMQGDALQYDLSADPGEPYAVADSPLILSEGGQCLQCPWTQSSVSAAGADAQLLFYSRTHGALVVGDWRLDLTLLPVTIQQNQEVRAMPVLDRHYTLTIDGSIGRYVLVVKGTPGEGPVFTGQTRAGLECVDCRSIDEDGQPSEILDALLEEFVANQIGFLCTISNCTISFDELVARTFIDKTATVITALVPGDADDEDTRVELRALPEGWRE